MYTNVPQVVAGSIASVNGVSTLHLLPALTITNPDTGNHIDSCYRVVGLQISATGTGGNPSAMSTDINDVAVVDSFAVQSWFLSYGMSATANRDKQFVIPEPGLQVFPPGLLFDAGIDIVVRGTGTNSLIVVIMQYFIDDISPD